MDAFHYAVVETQSHGHGAVAKVSLVGEAVGRRLDLDGLQPLGPRGQVVHDDAEFSARWDHRWCLQTHTQIRSKERGLDI